MAGIAEELWTKHKFTWPAGRMEKVCVAHLEFLDAINEAIERAAEFVEKLPAGTITTGWEIAAAIRKLKGE